MKSLVRYLLLIVFSTQFFVAVITPVMGFSLFSDSEITEFWKQSSESSAVTVDHDSWEQMLQRYIEDSEGVNLFSYSSVTESDKSILEKYMAQLQAIQVTELNSTEQFAFWINLYNALTVAVILEHYPLDSILDVSYSVLSQGPWKQKLVSVQDMELSLDDIEHEILRPIFQDNRIHYAVNCASMGCPNLQVYAFTSSELEVQLNQAARDYINHSRGVSIENDNLILSSIYDWYAEDFGNSDKEIIQHLMRFADPELGAKLAQQNRIDDYQYDWSLNE